MRTIARSQREDRLNSAFAAEERRLYRVAGFGTLSWFGVATLLRFVLEASYAYAAAAFVGVLVAGWAGSVRRSDAPKALALAMVASALSLAIGFALR